MSAFMFQGKVCGMLDGDVLVVKKDPARHHFNKYDGYGVNERMLVSAHRKGVRVLRMVIGGTSYDVPFTDLVKADHYDNRGEKQRIVTCTYLTGEPCP